MTVLVRVCGVWHNQTPLTGANDKNNPFNETWEKSALETRWETNLKASKKNPREAQSEWKHQESFLHLEQLNPSLQLHHYKQLMNRIIAGFF